MTRNNNLSPIPFYQSLDEQDPRKWYAQGEIYPLLVSKKTLLPFFFSLPYKLGRTIESIVLHDYCCDEDIVLPLTANLVANGLEIVSSEDYDVVTYPALDVNDLTLPYGRCYLIITTKYLEDGDYVYDTRYSEVFTVSPLENTTKIEWYSKDNQEYQGGFIPYGAVQTYKNVLYLDSEVAEPDYNTSEEGENREGYFFPLYQLSWKTFRTKFLAPEYLCDSLRLAFLSDRVKVVDRLGRAYQCDTFNITSEWLEGGHLASVEGEFTTDTVVKACGASYDALNDR